MRLFALLILGLAVPAARAQPAVSGRPVPSLSAFDDAMQDYMADHDIPAGVLGVMHDGRVVYLRGFGRKYDGVTPLPENALFRIASCTKPITAAAVHALLDDGASWSEFDNAFDLGQADGGVLDVTPFQALGDDRLEDVTIRQLLVHEGGWDRGVVGDLAFEWRLASFLTGVPSPPSPTAMLNWILSLPLQFTPGARTEYSNISYLSLGLLVEQESGRSLMDYIHRRVLTPSMWVPATEIQVGRTFRADQDPREPLYYSTTIAGNIYDNTDPYEEVATPYGGWPQPGLAGYGSFIASAPAMLAFLDRYHTGVYDDRIGEPITAANPVTGREGHNGILTGTNSYMVQRTDSVNVFIVFDKRGDPHYATGFYSDLLEPLLDAVTTWPTTTSDGFWVNTPGTGSSGTGGYNDAFASVGAAVGYAQDGSKLRLNPGASAWTGVLDTQLLIDAPRGSASLGN